MCKKRHKSSQAARTRPTIQPTCLSLRVYRQTRQTVSAANARSSEALMTRTAVLSVRLTGSAPVALVDHVRTERPGLDEV